MTDSTRLKATLFVAGLDNAVDTQILIDAFLPFGEIVDVNLPKPDLPSSKDPHRGFGYVEFENPADAAEAIDNMDQSELFGKVIKVAQAKPQQKEGGAAGGLGSKEAIWTQEGYLAKHAIKDEDRFAQAGQDGGENPEDAPQDPMQSLEGLDVAGPRPA